MRRIFNGILSICSLILLAACASNGVPVDAKYSLEKSRALNIVEMAGLEGLRDVPRQEWDSNSPIEDMLDAHYTVANVFTPAPGFGLAGGLAFSALFILASSEPNHPATYNHIWLWMPDELVSSTEEGNALAKKIVYEAVLKAFDPDDQLIERTRTFKPLFAGNSIY